MYEVQCSINSGQYDKGDIVDDKVATERLIKSGALVEISTKAKVTKPKEGAKIVDTVTSRKVLVEKREQRDETRKAANSKNKR